jgi:hypothetical protein
MSDSHFRLYRLASVCGNFVENFSCASKVKQDIGNFLDAQCDSRNYLHAIDWNLKQIIVYDDQGKKVNTYLKQGKGPGEFLQPSCIRIRNDSVYVSDINLPKIAVFNRDGQFVRELSFGHAYPRAFCFGNKGQIIALSRNESFVLATHDRNGKFIENFFPKQDILQGYDYFETHNFLLCSSTVNPDVIVLCQTMVGVLYIYDFANKKLLEKLHIRDHGLLGFGKEKIKQETGSRFIETVRGKIRAYFELLAHVTPYKNGFFFTFPVNEIDQEIAGFYLDLSTFEITLFFHSFHYGLCKLACPLNDDRIVLYNHDSLCLEYWTFVTD